MNLANRPPLGLKEPKVAPDPAYLARVRTLSCVICEAFGEPQMTPTTAHHTICGRYGARKTPDHQAVPLCFRHHQGEDGIHTDKATWVSKYGPDVDFIPPTQDKLGFSDG